MSKKGKSKIPQLIIVLSIIIITIIFKSYSFYWPKIFIKLADKELRVLVADTYKHTYKGWSDREDMGNVSGMMFLFASKKQHTMVMRDMNFSLDIVWLVGIDSDEKCFSNKFSLRRLFTGMSHSCRAKVVDIAPDLKPEVDISPEKLTPYFARSDSSIVLELPAGWAKENNLKIGDILTILD